VHKKHTCAILFSLSSADHDHCFNVDPLNILTDEPSGDFNISDVPFCPVSGHHLYISDSCFIQINVQAFLHRAIASKSKRPCPASGSTLAFKLLIVAALRGGCFFCPLGFGIERQRTEPVSQDAAAIDDQLWSVMNWLHKQDSESLCHR